MDIYYSRHNYAAGFQSIWSQLFIRPPVTAVCWRLATQTHSQPSNTHVCAHTHMSEGTITETVHTLFTLTLYYSKNKSKLESEKMWCDDKCSLSSFPDPFSSKSSPLRFNLNVKWDWLDYGTVEFWERLGERELGGRREEAIEAEGVKRWGALEYRAACRLSAKAVQITSLCKALALLFFVLLLLKVDSTKRTLLCWPKDSLVSWSDESLLQDLAALLFLVVIVIACLSNIPGGKKKVTHAVSFL